MTTKVTRFEIVGMVGEDKKLFYKILKDLQWDSRNQGNDVIKCLYENSRFKRVKLIEDYNIGKKTTKAQINDVMKQIYTKANPSGVETISRKVVSEWNTNQKKFGIGERTILSYRNSNSPLYVRDNQIKLIKDGKDYFVQVRLLSKDYATDLENGLEVTYGKGKKKQTITYKKNEVGQWVTFKLIVKGNFNVPIFERAMNGTYKIGTSQFLHKENRRKWFFNLTYTFESEKVQTLDPNRIMGIDVGVKVPAMLAISDNKWYKQPVGDAKEISDFQNQMKARYRRLQQSRKWCGDGSIGHGTKTRLKPLDKLSGKIKNFKDTKNHLWSRYIVDEAVKHNCGVIQMEDLSGIAEENTFLKTWTYYDLQQKIEYKAKEKGIGVVKVDPYKTSQRCSCCGHIAKENRQVQDKFECVNCGYGTKFYVNADWNAARNLSIDGIENEIKEQMIENEIKEQMKAQDKALKHSMKYVV